ncbi:MAG: HAD family hydrolase [Clostridiales bacterium 43-6]|nr:MAG: HAD family hydrolase [Clostridiales bacterium 43-6]
MNIKLIGFDADDTLWVNEPNYQHVEIKFCSLLSEFLDEENISEELLKTEKQNIELYGFGAKGFMLSLIETALRVSKNKVSNQTINEIIKLGKELIDKPVELIEGVENVLNELSQKYKLIVATKGDLLDQERKSKKSGIEKYFHHIEIMSDKKEENYKTLFDRLEIRPENFLMVGNSFKSDILPVVNLGGYGVYIPYHVIWQHEKIEEAPIDLNGHVKQIDNITELMKLV